MSAGKIEYDGCKVCGCKKVRGMLFYVICQDCGDKTEIRIGETI